MNYRYSQRMNDMLMKVFQVGEDWRNNMNEYKTFQEACVDKYNVAYGRTDGPEVYAECSKRVNSDQKERR